MALPKRRHSRMRRDKRRTHDKIKVKSLSLCKNCNQPKPGHSICPHCGYYKGKQILVKKEKKEKKRK
ncbi:MAG: 50S ribosomal protein L32 [Candidatus Omnitrophota bacterium]